MLASEAAYVAAHAHHPRFPDDMYHEWRDEQRAKRRAEAEAKRKKERDEFTALLKALADAGAINHESTFRKVAMLPAFAVLLLLATAHVVLRCADAERRMCCVCVSCVDRMTRAPKR